MVNQPMTSTYICPHHLRDAFPEVLLCKQLNDRLIVTTIESNRNEPGYQTIFLYLFCINHHHML